MATLCGAWNGVLVAYAGIQPMVATLILMIAGRGIAQLITNGVRIQIFYEPYAFFGNGWFFLPVSLFIVAVVFVVTWLFTRRTALGTFIEAVGINARSSFYSGIDEKRVKLVAYMFCGFCAGMAGIVASSSIRTSDANNIGLNFELDAILAVVIGGTALGAGGRFSLLGQHRRGARDPGDHDLDVRGRRPGQRAARDQGLRRDRRHPAVLGAGPRLGPSTSPCAGAARQ